MLAGSQRHAKTPHTILLRYDEYNATFISIQHILNAHTLPAGRAHMSTPWFRV
jgi:hypothetical protein